MYTFQKKDDQNLATALSAAPRGTFPLRGSVPGVISFSSRAVLMKTSRSPMCHMSCEVDLLSVSSGARTGQQDKTPGPAPPLTALDRRTDVSAVPQAQSCTQTGPCSAESSHVTSGSSRLLRVTLPHL